MVSIRKVTERKRGVREGSWLASPDRVLAEGRLAG